ncbi:MAG: hypothetical protein ACE5J0_03370 [Candidatus Paceibacterales bacterium]
MIIQLLILFIFIEVIQAWLILFEKRIFKGVWGIILTEILELPLELYLILRGELSIILIVISVMALQWLAIVILFSFLE